MKLYVHLRALATLALALALAPAHALVLAINEGVTYRVTNEEIRVRYVAIAADLAKILRQPVTIEPVGHYPTLRAGLERRAYDLALVHPAHHSIFAIQRSGYRLVAVTRGYENYRARFLVRADSTLKGLGELKGKRLGAPAEDSITAWIVRATLRDNAVDPGTVAITYTRYQDAVPFFVENTLTHAGATASNAVVKAWTDGGGKVLAESRPVPIKHVIAAPSLTREQVAAVRDYLVNLDTTDEGRKKLEPTRLRGFMPYDEAAMLELGRWLGL